MNCPVCKSIDQHASILKVHSNGLNETIEECRVCATVWSISHGKVEIVRDQLKGSFLSAEAECVENNDYNYACA